MFSEFVEVSMLNMNTVCNIIEGEVNKVFIIHLVLYLDENTPESDVEAQLGKGKFSVK